MVYTVPVATTDTTKEEASDEAVAAFVEKIRQKLRDRGETPDAQRVTQVALKWATRNGYRTKPGFNQRLMRINAAALKAQGTDVAGGQSFADDALTAAAGGLAAPVAAFDSDLRADLNTVRQDVASRHGLLGNAALAGISALPAVGAATAAAMSAPVTAPLLGASTVLAPALTASGLAAGGVGALMTVPEQLASKNDELAADPTVSTAQRVANLAGTGAVSTAANFIPGFGVAQRYASGLPQRLASLIEQGVLGAGATGAEAGVDALTGLENRIGLEDVAMAGAGGALSAAPFLAIPGGSDVAAAREKAVADEAAARQAAAEQAFAEEQARLEAGLAAQQANPLPEWGAAPAVPATPMPRFVEPAQPPLPVPDPAQVPPAFDPTAPVPTSDVPRFAEPEIPAPDPALVPPLPPEPKPKPKAAPVQAAPEAVAPTAPEAPAQEAPAHPNDAILADPELDSVGIVDADGKPIRISDAEREADGRWRGFDDEGNAVAFDPSEVIGVRYLDGRVVDLTKKAADVPRNQPAPEPPRPVPADGGAGRDARPVSPAPSPAPAAPSAPAPSLRDTLTAAETTARSKGDGLTYVYTTDGRTYIHHQDDGIDRFYPFNDNYEGPESRGVPVDIEPGRIKHVIDATGKKTVFEQPSAAPAQAAPSPAPAPAPVARPAPVVDTAAAAREARASGNTWQAGADPRVTAGRTSVVSADAPGRAAANVIEVQGDIGIQHDPAKGYRVVRALPQGASKGTRDVAFSPVMANGKAPRTVADAKAATGKWYATLDEAATAASRLDAGYRPKNEGLVGRVEGLARVEAAGKAASHPKARDVGPLIQALEDAGFKQSADQVRQLRAENERLEAEIRASGASDRATAEQLDAGRGRLRQTAGDIASEAERARVTGEKPDPNILFARYGRRAGAVPRDTRLDGARSVGEVVSRLRDGADSELVTLGDAILARGVADTPVDVRPGLYDGRLPDGATPEEVTGFYDPDTGRITLFPDAIAFQAARGRISPADLGLHVALHEEVHAQTLARLDSDPAFRDDVRRMADIAAEAWVDMYPDRRLPYGVDAGGVRNAIPDEFLSEAMSNREFREFLKQVRADGGRRSLWEMFVGAVANTLRRAGIDIPDTSLLAKAMDAYEYASALPTGGETRKWQEFSRRAANSKPSLMIFRSLNTPAMKAATSKRWGKTFEWFTQNAPQALHAAGRDRTGNIWRLLERSNAAQQTTARLNEANADDVNTFIKADKKNPNLGKQILDNRAAAARAGRTLTTASALSMLRSQGFSAAEVDAAEALFRTYQRDNTERATAFRAAAKAASTPEERTAFEQAAKGYEQRAKEAYVPLARRGDYFAATAKEARAFDTAEELAAWKAEQTAKGEKITRESIKASDPFRSSGTAAQQLETFGATLAKAGYDPAAIKDILDDVRPVLLDRTALASNLKAEGVPGYDTDIANIVGEGLPRRATVTGRLLANTDPRYQGLEADIQDPNSGMTERDRKWAVEWLADQQRPISKSEKATALFGAATAISGLMAPVTGLTNLVSQLPAAQIAGYVGGSQIRGTLKGLQNMGLGFGRMMYEALATAEGLRRGVESANTKFDVAARRVEMLQKTGRPEDAALAAALKKSAASGTLYDSDTRIKNLADSGRLTGQRLADMLLWVQNHTTRISRVQTWELGARLWQKGHNDPKFWERVKTLGYTDGMEKMDMGRFADWWVTRIEGGYGREHRPAVAREGMASLAYTFQTYTHNQVQLLATLARNSGVSEEEKRLAGAALLAYLGSLTALGGVLSALPAAKTLLNLWDTAVGEGEKTIDMLERKYGTFWTRSLIAQVMPDGMLKDVVASVGERAGLGSAAAGVPGVEIPIQVARGLGQTVTGARDMLKGGTDYYSGRDAVKQGVRTMAPQLDRYRAAATGDELRSAAGKVQVVDTTPGERAGLALGVVPKRQQEARKEAAASRPAHQARLRAVADEIADAYVEGDTPRRLAAVKAYNDLVAEVSAAFRAETEPKRKAVLAGQLRELNRTAFNKRVGAAVRRRRDPAAARVTEAPAGYRPAVAAAVEGN